MLLLLTFFSYFSPITIATFSIITYIFSVNLLVEEIEHITLALLSLIILYLIFPSIEKGIYRWVIIALVISCIFFSVRAPILIYIFFEIGLIPVAIIIIAWGLQPERISAIYHLLIYTITFSAPLLLIIIYTETNIIFIPRYFIRTIIFFAFIAKTPLYFLHVWLPKAHVEAATAGRIILAGILLKTGGIGFLWLINYLFLPWNLILYSLALLGIIIAAISCRLQRDIKAFVAYSSVAHINYSTLIVIINSAITDRNSRILILAHGFVSSSIFLIVGRILHHLQRRIVYFRRSSILFKEIRLTLLAFILIRNFSFPPSIAFLGELFSLRIIIITFWIRICRGILYFIFIAYYSFYLLLSRIGTEGTFNIHISINSTLFISRIRLLNTIFLVFYYRL